MLSPTPTTSRHERYVDFDETSEPNEASEASEPGTLEAAPPRFRTDAPPPAEAKASRPIALVAALALGAAVVAVVVLTGESTSASAPEATSPPEESAVAEEPEAAPTEWVLEIAGAPEGARATRDGVAVADLSRIALDGEPTEPIVLELSADGYLTREVRIERGAFADRDDAMRARVTVEMERVPPPAPRVVRPTPQPVLPEPEAPIADPASPLPENPF
jgi:hypothetical protein